MKRKSDKREENEKSSLLGYRNPCLGPCFYFIVAQFYITHIIRNISLVCYLNSDKCCGNIPKYPSKHIYNLLLSLISILMKNLNVVFFVSFNLRLTEYYGEYFSKTITSIDMELSGNVNHTHAHEITWGIVL